MIFSKVGKDGKIALELVQNDTLSRKCLFSPPKLSYLAKKEFFEI